MFSKKNTPRADPKIEELRIIGLASYWLDVAEAIGADNFLAMWEILAKSDSVQAAKNAAYVPSYAVWGRYQRNLVITSLHTDGLTALQIQARLKSDLKESISVERIKRIINKSL